MGNAAVWASLVSVAMLLSQGTQASPTPDFAGAFHDPRNTGKKWSPTLKRPHIYLDRPGEITCNTPYPAPNDVQTIAFDSDTVIKAMPGSIEASGADNWQNTFTLKIPVTIKFVFNVKDDKVYGGWKHIQEVTVTDMQLVDDKGIPLKGFNCFISKHEGNSCTTAAGASTPC